MGVRMLTVAENRHETPSSKTMMFEEKFHAVPGQFVMVWVPGVDEFPMSVSFMGEQPGITYQVIGEGTRTLAEKRPGEKVGIRGPYGKGFAIHGLKLLVVGGGLGMAPLAPFVEDAIEHKASVEVVVGARTAEELLFVDRVSRAGAAVHISTDDGSRGFKGLATELAGQVAGRAAFDSVYACGPEKMIVGLLGIEELARLPLQASLERIIKCGIGICDSCALDGKHVCRDGPVFNERELRTFEDLGRTKLDSCGRRTPV